MFAPGKNPTCLSKVHRALATSPPQLSVLEERDSAEHLSPFTSILRGEASSFSSAAPVQSLSIVSDRFHTGINSPAARLSHVSVATGRNKASPAGESPQVNVCDCFHLLPPRWSRSHATSVHFRPSRHSNGLSSLWCRIPLVHRYMQWWFTYLLYSQCTVFMYFMLIEGCEELCWPAALLTFNCIELFAWICSFHSRFEILCLHLNCFVWSMNVINLRINI